MGVLKPWQALLVICLFAGTVYSLEITDPTYNANCHVDLLLHPDEDDNYVDCASPEMTAAGKTRCCDVETSKGCCTEETQGGKMIAIGTSIAFITLGIMSGCIIVFWCNTDTFPCLKKYEQRCPCLRKKPDEFSGLYEKPPEVSYQGTSANGEPMVAIAARPRAIDRDEFAPKETYHTPDEVKGQVAPDWWD